MLRGRRSGGRGGAATLCVAGLLLAIPGARPADWPIYRGDARLSGHAETVLPAAPVRLWSVSLGRTLKSSPVVAGGRVVIGADDGTLRCLALDSGKGLWQFKTSGTVEGPPLISGDLVVVGTDQGALHAVSLGSGTAVWSFAAQDRIVGGANLVTAADGALRLLVGSYDMNVYCLNAASGAKQWSFETANYVNATPAVDDQRVVFGGCDGLLHVLAAEDGRELRSVAVGSYVAAPVAVENGQAYVGHYGGEVLCVDLETATVRWRVSPGPAGEAILGPLAICGDLLVAGSRDGAIYALERTTGATRWSYRSGGPIDSGAVACGSQVVFGSADGRVYLVSAKDGAKLWSYEVGAAVSTAPAVVGACFLLGAEDGSLHAFGPAPAGTGAP